MNAHKHIYGLVAEFDDEQALLAAAKRAYDEGYRNMDAYAPYPVHGLADAIGMKHTRVPLIVLLGGIFGATAAIVLQMYASVWHYPHNIGGRPYLSWPAFIPVTFELTVLCAAIAGVVGMFWLNGLPEPYHPIFNVQSFKGASQDCFFLCIEATDPKFDQRTTEQFLMNLNPRGVMIVQP